jgi:hypothetical protein
MTNEDKELISDYMGWRTKTHAAHVFNMHKDFVFTTCDNGYINTHFDLNVAGACVREMQKRDDWFDFVTYADVNDTERYTWSQFFAWLYNADNFFEVMAKWLKEEKK